MKTIAMMTLMLTAAWTGTYAQNAPVKMTLSGTAKPSTINLRPGTTTFEYTFGGHGTFGQFTFRTLNASVNTPEVSSSCPAPKLYLPAIAGAGVFRFHDGSLLKVNLVEGSDCVDITIPQAICVRMFQITGGTGRFQSASGMIALTETVQPILADAGYNPVFFAITGEITGAISGVGKDVEGTDVGL